MRVAQITSYLKIPNKESYSPIFCLVSISFCSIVIKECKSPTPPPPLHVHNEFFTICPSGSFLTLSMTPSHTSSPPTNIRTSLAPTFNSWRKKVISQLAHDKLSQTLSDSDVTTVISKPLFLFASSETHKGLKRLTLICLLCPILVNIHFLRPQRRFSNMVLRKMNIHDHRTPFTRFNPLRVADFV